VGKIAEKAACKSVFLTKRTPSDCFLTILPTGNHPHVGVVLFEESNFLKSLGQLFFTQKR